ncbi:MAG: hypothetical protein Q8R96_08755 [Bacteroidota bacterium]|nr:hypothetical protein [Bacteroidota bacterium]
MKIRKTFIITLLIVSATFGSLNTMAQQETTKIKQEVEVVKAYQPTISEVEKINDIPKIKTEQTEAPVFDYSIFSKPVFSTFDVTPVAAAKMVGEPKPEMEMGLLKLGFGNYMTPYGELFFNSQPDKNSNFGMHFKHLSSYGKIGLLNGDIVKAPQSENIAEIFGEKFWRKSTLSGSLAFDRKSFNYYGYTGDMLSDELKDEMIPYYQDKQYFSKGTASIGLKGENISPLDFNYNFRLKYHYFKTKTGQTENQTVFSGDMSKKYGQTFGLLNTSLTYYLADGVMNNFSNSIGPKQQILIRINPSVMWKTEGAKLQAGVNSTIVFDDDTDASMLIWPKVKAEWSPVPKILTIFAGVDGHLQHNTYSNIAAENPYVDPFHDVLNTNYKYIVSGGLKGKFSSKTNYVAEASYSKVKDQHFYIIESVNFNNPAASIRQLNNTFSWVYDDLKVLKLSAEVMHSVSENFSLRLLGNYYSYELETIEKAWQMPDFDVTFSGIYKPTEQLKFTTDIFVVGKRTALISEPSVSSLFSLEVEMDPIIDLNAGVDYQFNNSLNFFVRLNNFGFQKYEQWLGYTNKSFNWMAGISYTF